MDENNEKPAGNEPLEEIVDNKTTEISLEITEELLITRITESITSVINYLKETGIDEVICDNHTITAWHYYIMFYNACRNITGKSEPIISVDVITADIRERIIMSPLVSLGEKIKLEALKREAYEKPAKKVLKSMKSEIIKFWDEYAEPSITESYKK